MSRGGALSAARPGSETGELGLVAFADLGGSAWGLAVTVGSSGLAITGSASGTVQGPAAVSLASSPGGDGEGGEAGACELTGAELRLRVVPAAGISAAPTEAPEKDDPADVVHERCRVLGTLSDGAELSAPGVWIRHRTLSLRDLDSLREVVALFDEGVDYAVSALRPRKGKGHDRDAIRASVLAEDTAADRVEDPRLSTAYDAEGNVLRTGLELWLEAEEAAGDELFPHRTAAEAAAPPARLELEQLVVEATLMRAHSRGREGVALYSLLRPR